MTDTDTDALHRLLDVQAQDTSTDQLRHRKTLLPELEQLATLRSRHASLEAQRNSDTALRDEILRRQRAAETELASVEAKLAAVQQRMYSGTVTVARELQAMEAERDALRRRADTTENDALSAMTERDPLDKSIAAATEELQAVHEETARLELEVASIREGIDEELAKVTASRAELAQSVPDEVMDLYEGLRTRLGGVGIASLVNGRCGGCHLTLSASEIDHLRKSSGSITRCEQCSRILVGP